MFGRQQHSRVEAATCVSCSLEEELHVAEQRIKLDPRGPFRIVLRYEGGDLPGGRPRRARRPGAALAHRRRVERRAGRHPLAVRVTRGSVAKLDAPVSRGVSRAGTGKLAIMAGATPQRSTVRSRCSRRREAPSSARSDGSAHAMKALNDFVSAGGFLIGIEAPLIGQRFSLALMVKDLGIALGVANATSTPAPFSSLCRDMWASTQKVLGPAGDHTAVVKFSELIAGLSLGGDAAGEPTRRRRRSRDRRSRSRKHFLCSRSTCPRSGCMKLARDAGRGPARRRGRRRGAGAACATARAGAAALSVRPCRICATARDPTRLQDAVAGRRTWVASAIPTSNAAASREPRPNVPGTPVPPSPGCG